MKLEFQKVGAAYGAKPVLEDVTFTVSSGSISVLLGRNGAGKSTLLACLTGQKRDYTGRIVLDDREVRSLAPRQRAELVACLPQELPMPRVTVRELAAFGRAPYLPLTGSLRGPDREAVETAIRAVGLADLRDALVDELSGGQRKKAFFAMTLAQDAPVVVLDEPTAHLDAASRFEFLDLVERLRQTTGKTFLLVMHELPEALRCADRVAVLSERRLVFEGTPEECLAEGVPERCFGVRVTGSRESGFGIVPIGAAGGRASI